MQLILIGFLALILAACSNGPDQAAPTLPSAVETLSIPPQESPTPPIPPAATPTATFEPPASTPTQPAPPATPTQPAPSPAPTASPTAGETPAPSGFPDPSAYTWELVSGGLNSPIGIANAGDGSGRLFILEQAGQIRIFLNGELLPAPFLDIRSKVGSLGSEQGLLGLAFHPRFAENGLFYINYTNFGGDTVIARLQVSASDPNQADPGSETGLLLVSQPFPNHNGGMLAFGPDGYLYIGLGDGGSAGDPQGNGQSLDTLLGKILRIDVDGGDPYGIPPDNPFAQGGGRAEIWAYGLRNPWRFSFDRQTGDLYTGDVGQGSFEEVDFQPASSSGGENYGWDITEGFQCYNTAGCDTSGLTLPVFVYPTHVEGTCAITGGYVYRGGLPAWQGIYLFGDYCAGRVWGLFLDPQGEWQGRALFENAGQITSFGEDEAGEIYLADSAGSIYRLAEK